MGAPATPDPSYRHISHSLIVELNFEIAAIVDLRYDHDRLRVAVFVILHGGFLPGSRSHTPSSGMTASPDRPIP